MRKTRQRCFIEKLSLKKLMTFVVMLCMLFSAVLMPAAYASEYDVSVQSEDQVLADGVYYIKKGDSYFTSNFTFQTSKYTSVPDSLTQMWKIYHVGDGSYTIRPMDSLSCCLNGAGTQLQLYGDPVDDVDELMAHSRWLITEATEGYQITIYTYRWKLSEFFISISSGSWELERVTSPPSGVLLKSTQAWIAPKSTATFRAAVYSGSTIDQSVTWSSSNTNVATVSSSGVVTGVSQGTATITAKSTYNTSWQKSFTVNVSLVPNGTYYIKNKASGKVVDIYNSNTNEGESIHHFDVEGTDDQKWIFELQQDGYYTIKSVYSNLYLSVKNNSTSNGSEVVQNSGGAADGQRWSISTTSSSAYKLKAKCAGSQDLCLMKGTYIFYPNKLVHMAYTDDSTYDDEWDLVTNCDATLVAIPEEGHYRDDSFPYVKTYLSNMGYSNRVLYYVDQNTCKLMLVSSKIFYSRSHGSKTSIQLNDSSLNISSLNSMPDNALSECRLVLYGACATGNGGSGANNLVNATAAKGAQTVIGFTKTIYAAEVNIWATWFFAALDNGYSVTVACQKADEKVLEKWNAVDENGNKLSVTTNSWYIAGSTSQTFDS